MSLVEGLWESESEVRCQARKQALRLKTQEQCGRLLADCWKVVKPRGVTRVPTAWLSAMPRKPYDCGLTIIGCSTLLESLSIVLAVIETPW